MQVTITDIQNDKGALQFVLSGDYEYGLDKSVVNAIRRTLLNDIPTVAFETSEDIDVNDRDLKINTNNSPLHNEMLAHRISLIPLYLDPELFLKTWFFDCHVKHDTSKPFRFITANDMNIYPLRQDLIDRINDMRDEAIETDPRDEQSLRELLATNDPDNYDQSDSSRLTQKDKDEILRPYEFRGDKTYCLINELKSTGTKDVHQEVHFFGSPSVKTAQTDSRYQAVSQAAYSFLKDDDLIRQTLEDKIKLQEIPEDEKSQFTRKFMLGESARYFKRDKDNEPNQYLFKIKSTHFWTSEDLFKKALDLLMGSCETLKQELLKILQEKVSSVSVDVIDDHNIVYTINNQSHSLGNLLQSHIVRRIIQSEEGTPNDSLLLSCGYKKPHPLKEELKLFISVDPNQESIKKTEPHKYPEMVSAFLMDQLEVIKLELKDIYDLAEQSL